MSEAQSTRDVIFHLNDDEVRERGERLANTIQDIEATKTKAKEIAGEYSRRVKAAEARASDLAEAVATKQEKRPVLCEERLNARLFRMDTVRLDTQEVVDTRPLNDDEMADIQQAKLFTDEDARRAAPTDDPDGPADTHNLPDPEVFDPLRAPDGRIDCPGPEGGSGCEGEACTRCAGALFIPAPIDDDPEPGTEITDPGAVVAPVAGAEGKRGGKKGTRSGASAAH